MRIFTLALSLSVAACAHFNPAKTPHTEEASGTETTKQEETLEYSDFNPETDTLYDLLVAEIAAQRNQMNVALLNYIQQARQTRDPGVIRRAINAAQFSKDLFAIKELGLLWVEVEPDNPSAHQLMAYQYSLEKNYSEAIHHIDRVIELGGRISIESLAIGSQSLPDEDKKELLALYQKLYEKHPDSLPVRYSLAIVQSNLKDFEGAEKNLNGIMESDPDFQAAYVLKSNILFEQGKKEQTFDFVESSYERFPSNHSLGRLYASLLIDRQDLERAEEVFDSLMTYYPQMPAFKLSHALVMLENKKVDAAATSLEELLQKGYHSNEANFYLGRIADQREEVDKAVGYYLAIDGGMHFNPALERAGYLLMKAQRFEEAGAAFERARKRNPQDAIGLWITEFKLLNTLGEDERALATLNKAIEDQTSSEDLLYARAMLMEQKDNLPEMENDLRKIIELNPENAIALNALGYTLADKTDRLEEAADLISRALKIKPENPAILDSMGWVLFKMGRNEESLAFLLSAFQKYSDGEIGAHLGEVLLSMNQSTEAREVWTKAMELDPEHPVLIETLKRLAPDLLPAETDATSEETSTEQSETEAQ